jgi:hypothetical protein
MASFAFASASSVSANGSNTPNFLLPNFTQMSIEKLEGSNYLAWLSRIEPIIHSHELMGFLDGSEVCTPQFLSNEGEQRIINPEFTCWIKKDQFLLS